MVRCCPRCSQKNRIPDTHREGGEYRCGHCGQSLTPKVAQAARRRLPGIVPLLNGLYLLILVILFASNSFGPELWWPGSLNLYLPQWLWVLPLAVLLPLTYLKARRLLWLPLLALLWGLGPIMGFCGYIPFKPAAARGSGTPIRVMTYNVKWGSRDSHAIVQDVVKYHPDLLQMQDSEGVLSGELGQALTGWNVRFSGQYIVASPHPLPELETRDISFSGTHHHCVRYTLAIGPRTVTVYDVHLLSPRSGLIAMRHRRIEGMDGNVKDRLLEAARMAGYVREEPGPTLLTGDLNAPVQSLVCRSLFETGLRDAFSEAGLGYGYTYGRYTRVGQPYVRIDHILVSKEWQVAHCEVGNKTGSDHCPVVADLVLH